MNKMNVSIGFVCETDVSMEKLNTLILQQIKALTFGELDYLSITTMIDDE